MMWAIIVCTVLYIAIALVLTGVVSYKELKVGEPLAFVFNRINLSFFSGVIALSAIVAMASVLLVFQMGQPRIWMSMSRDGLLPKRFSKIHPKYKTPSFSTIVVGFVVAVPALFMNLTTVTDLCSIGTLFAFVLVCGGVLMLQNRTDIPRGKFRTPYINAKYVMPVLLIATAVLLFTRYSKETLAFLSNQEEVKSQTEIVEGLDPNQILGLKNTLYRNHYDQFMKADTNVVAYYEHHGHERLIQDLKDMNVQKATYLNSGIFHFLHKIPMWIFILFTLFITAMAFLHNLSLIPILGLLSCLYMMSQINVKNWFFFFVWLALGLLIYFTYGRKNSKLGNPSVEVE